MRCSQPPHTSVLHANGWEKGRSRIELAQLAASFAAFVTVVVVSFTEAPLRPVTHQTPAAGWWHAYGGAGWAIDVPLFDVATQGSVLSPFRGTMHDYSVQIALAAAALIMHSTFTNIALLRWWAAAMASCLLAGACVLPAGAGQPAVLVFAMLAAALSVWQVTPMPEQRGVPFRAAFAGVAPAHRLHRGVPPPREAQ